MWVKPEIRLTTVHSYLLGCSKVADFASEIGLNCANQTANNCR